MAKGFLKKVDKNFATKVKARLTTLSPNMAKQEQVIATMLTDGEALLNRGLLLRRLKEFGISGTSWWKGLDHFADWRNTNLLGPQQIPNTSDDLAGTVFDVVSIDGNHSYSWAKRDYENLGKHAAKICAFHDINAKEYIPEGGGAFKFWRELRATVAREAPMIDFSHAVPGPGVSSDGLWMGIGIVDFSRKHEAV